MGTWKLAIMSMHNPDHLYFVKNSGNMILGKADDSIVVTTEDAFFNNGS